VWRSDPVTSALNVVTVGERFIFSNALRGKGNVFDRQTGTIVSSIGQDYACCRFTLSEPYVLGATMDMIDLSDCRGRCRPCGSGREMRAAPSQIHDGARPSLCCACRAGQGLVYRQVIGKDQHVYVFFSQLDVEGRGSAQSRWLVMLRKKASCDSMMTWLRPALSLAGILSFPGCQPPQGLSLWKILSPLSQMVISLAPVLRKTSRSVSDS
jgi:hypothetical protein